MPKTESAPALPTTSEGWTGLIGGLERHRARAEAELERIAERRRSVALAALSGDADAARTVSELTAREGELHRVLANLRDAQADAETRRDAAAKVEAEAARAERMATAREVGAELLARSREADAAFATLAAALRGRADAVAHLGAYGVTGRRLAKPSYVSAAAAAAGLHGLLDLGWVSRQVAGTLAATDEKLLATLLPTVAAVPARPVAAGHEPRNADEAEQQARDAEHEADAVEVARAQAYWRENPAEDDRELERRRAWLASKRAA